MSWRSGRPERSTAVPGGGGRRLSAAGGRHGRLRRPYGRLMAGRAARARAGIVQKKILGGEGKQSAAGPLLPRPLWFFVLKKPEEPGERGGQRPSSPNGRHTRGAQSGAQRRRAPRFAGRRPLHCRGRGPLPSAGTAVRSIVGRVLPTSGRIGRFRRRPRCDCTQAQHRGRRRRGSCGSRLAFVERRRQRGTASASKSQRPSKSGRPSSVTSSLRPS